MQRNHYASGLLRACRQVPNWASWGGRTNAYAAEWIQLTSAQKFYRKAAVNHSEPSSMTIWFKSTELNIANGVKRNLFAVYDAGVAHDIFSLELEGSTANGNMLNFLFMGIATPAYTQPTNLGINWHNVTMVWDGGVTEIWLDGSMIHTGPQSYNGAISAHTLGLGTPAGGAAPVYLDKCIIDEVAFFDVPVNPVTIYNNGTPLDYDAYGIVFVGLNASYDFDSQSGAINAKYISPAAFPSGTSPLPFSMVDSPTGFVEITTNALKSTDTTQFTSMAEKYGDYVAGLYLQSLSFRNPIGLNVDMSIEACGLMPYPAGGGFNSLGYTGAWVAKEDPFRTPHMSKATTMVTEDSTAYAAMGGSASLTGVTDARAGRLFLPRFVKR